MASTAGYLARRAAQKERVRLLYRRALRDTLNWAVHRHLFYQDVGSPFPLSNPDLDPPPCSRMDLTSCSSPAQASDLRDKFEANRHVVSRVLLIHLRTSILHELLIYAWCCQL